jgi:hypothetical protein
MIAYTVAEDDWRRTRAIETEDRKTVSIDSCENAQGSR